MENILVEYDTAPWDVIGEHASVGGAIIVAKKGDQLPLETKYKRKGISSIPVKFLVSKLLEVVAVEKGKKLDILMENVVKEIHTNPPPSINIDEPIEAMFDVSDTSTFDTTRDMVDDEVTKIVVESEVVEEKNFMSEAEFLADLDSRFEMIVIGGLEVGMRKSVKEKLTSDKVLLGKENNAVINSLNLAVASQFGNNRPSAKLCAKLAEILKNKFPATFRVQAAVQSSFGPLSLPRSRGTGGNSDLIKRLGNCFYNQIVRPTIRRAVRSEDIQAPVGGKKKKKVLGVNAEKWNSCEMASKAEKSESVKSYKRIAEAVSMEEKKKLLKDS